MNQSLSDLIDNQPPEFVQHMVKSDNVPFLIKELETEKCPDRKAIITARIENLNHLMV